jgi:hypothetical protein
VIFTTNLHRATSLAKALATPRHMRINSYATCSNKHSAVEITSLNNLRRGRLRLKYDGTRAETKFGLSAKRTSPFKSAGASVQSTTGSRCVLISWMLDTLCSEVV